MENITEIESGRIYEIDQCLILPLPLSVNAQSAAYYRTCILEEVEKRAVREVILDMSCVAVLDHQVFRILQDTVGMVKIMGANTLFVGFLPGVAASLVDLAIDTEAIETAMDLNEGMALLRKAGRIQDHKGKLDTVLPEQMKADGESYV